MLRLLFYPLALFCATTAIAETSIERGDRIDSGLTVSEVEKLFVVNLGISAPTELGCLLSMFQRLEFPVKCFGERAFYGSSYSARINEIEHSPLLISELAAEQSYPEKWFDSSKQLEKLNWSISTRKFWVHSGWSRTIVCALGSENEEPPVDPGLSKFAECFHETSMQEGERILHVELFGPDISRWSYPDRAAMQQAMIFVGNFALRIRSF